MSYDNPSKRETYVLPSASHGSATDSLAIKGPKGKSGTVKDIRSYVTTSMAGSTTVPEISVGSAVSAIGTLKTEYARFRLGTGLTTGYPSTGSGTPFRARALADAAQGAAGGTPPVLNDFPGHIALETAKIPADTQVFITRLLGVGTPAGAGSTEVDVDWD